MLNFLKPVPVIFTTLFTLFGLLMHDMHIDKATMAAVAVPVVAVSTAAALEKAITPSYHTHVESASFGPSFRSSMPKMQPPRNDGNRYIQNKKLLFMGGGDTVGIWPSV